MRIPSVSRQGLVEIMKISFSQTPLLQTYLSPLLHSTIHIHNTQLFQYIRYQVSIIKQFALRWVHRPFQSEFPRQHDLVFPLSVSSALVSLTTFRSCLHLLPLLPEPFCLFISKVLQKAPPTQDVIKQVRRTSFYPTQDVPFSLTICNTSFFT